MSKTVPVRELRSGLSQFIDQVADLREHVIVTRRGRPAAVLVPVDEYEALEETAEILSDTDALTAGGFAASTDTVEISQSANGIGPRWDTFQNRLRERRKEVIHTGSTPETIHDDLRKAS